MATCKEVPKQRSFWKVPFWKVRRQQVCNNRVVFSIFKYTQIYFHCVYCILRDFIVLKIFLILQLIQSRKMKH